MEEIDVVTYPSEVSEIVLVKPSWFHARKAPFSSKLKKYILSTF